MPKKKKNATVCTLQAEFRPAHRSAFTNFSTVETSALGREMRSPLTRTYCRLRENAARGLRAFAAASIASGQRELVATRRRPASMPLEQAPSALRAVRCPMPLARAIRWFRAGRRLRRISDGPHLASSTPARWLAAAGPLSGQPGHRSPRRKEESCKHGGRTRRQPVV